MAFGAAEIEMGRLVSVPAPAIEADTPSPLMTDVTPERFVPVIVAETTLSCITDVGLTAVIAGIPGAIVRPANGAEVPAPELTATVRVPIAAAPATLIVIGTAVLVPPGPMAAVIPGPLTETAFTPDRFAPRATTDTIAPCAMVAGTSEVIRGTVVTPTVKAEKELDICCGVVTVTVLGPGAASGAMVTATGRLVSVPPFMIVAVTPVPANVTTLTELRFVPPMVVETVVP